MHNLTLSEEFYRVAYIRVVDKPEQVVIGNTRFLLCRQVLVKIRQNIPLDTDVLHVIRHSGRRNGINSRRVVNEVCVKAGFLYLFLGKVPRQLIDDSRHHFKMRKLLCTQRSIGNVPKYQI